MSLLDEWYDRDEKKPEDPAKKILFAVLDDLLDRSGFDDGWGMADSETKEEILATNLEKVRSNLPS